MNFIRNEARVVKKQTSNYQHVLCCIRFHISTLLYDVFVPSFEDLLQSAYLVIV